MQLEAMRTLYNRLRPYSNQDYIRDAKSIIITRITTNRFDPTALYSREIGDPSHAAKWSALSRKRKSGLMLLTLYELSIRYELDMTSTLGNRLLLGIYGASISTNVLTQVFSNTGRTAADRSEDWPKVERIIKDNKTYYQGKLEQARARIAANKELSWELVQLELSGRKSRANAKK